MSEEAAPAGEAAVSYAIPADAPAEMSVSDAARMLSQARKAKTEPEQPAESAPDATADQSAVEAGAAPEEGTTVKDTETEPEAPAIDPPRSWSKDAHERWSKLDRETQEFLATRDSEDQRAIKRSLQEAADARKAAEAERSSVEQLRRDYEAKLPVLAKTMEATLQQEFGDIQSIADVRKLQAEDPFRFQQWQLRQMELAAVQQEQQAAERNQAQEKQSSWMKFVQEESKAFAEDEPEFKAKESEYTSKAKNLLEDLGFTQAELNKLATGEDKVSLYDRRFQKLLFRAVRLEEFKSAPAKAAPKTLPPVQRPGVARGNVSVTAQIQNLETRLSQATGKTALLVAAELTALKRKAGAR